MVGLSNTRAQQLMRGRPCQSKVGRKVGVCCAPFRGGAASPSNTASPWPRPSSVPSGILIHPAVWPQYTWAEKWGMQYHFPWGRSPSNIMSPVAYLRTKRHSDPSSRLATIDMGQKLGAAVPLSVGELRPHLTQRRLGPGLAQFQVVS